MTSSQRPTEQGSLRLPAGLTGKNRSAVAARKPARIALSLLLLTQGMALFAPPAAAQQRVALAPARQTTTAAQSGATGSRIQISGRAVANFARLSREEQLNPSSPGSEEMRAIPPPRPLPYDQDPLAGRDGAQGPSVGMGGLAQQEGEGNLQPAVPGPPPAQSYHAQEDIARIGSTARFIPPDIHGAVGRTRSMSVTNNNYRVYEKLTGAPVSSMGIQQFWSPLAPHPGAGDNGLFDPRVQYDPYNDRFIHYVLAGSISANNEMLIAVSQTGDPNGTYNYYSFVVGTSNLGADFPTVGFNKNWLVVGLNMFSVAAGGVTQGNVITIDYPAARSGAASPTAVRFVTPDNVFFFGTGLCPADTYSPSENSVYLLRNFNNNTTGRLQMYRVNGTPASPTVSIVNDMINSGDFWNTGSEGNFLPQLNVSSTPTAPSSTIGIEAGDARIQNVVFRNGSLWAVHKIGIPATVNTATVRVGVQWWQLTTAGAITQRGRVEDPTATQANGGSHYAWPSIAVNKNNDAIINYSEFEEDDYADTGYSFRLASDAANTMRDPVIYQEGLDNYASADGNGRVRWGDYTMAVPDPSNDLDLWVLGEYAHQKVPVTGGFSSRHDTWWAKVAVPAGAGDLLISEFRLRGPNGANDEFIEIYNNSGSAHTVQTADGSSGYAVAAQDDVVRCTIPNGTLIPARGHYLCVNSVGYSLASYPAGNGTTATGDATYTTEIPDNSGVAIFRTATAADFNAANRIDAAGFTTTPPSVYVEGTGIPALGGTAYLSGINHSLYRDNCGKSGSITTFGPCPTAGSHKDTNNNAADFVFVDTNGTSAGAGQRLGAPGPENLSSPVISSPGSIGFVLLDATAGANNPPNRVRDLTSDPANNSTFGTLELRRRVINSTGAPVTRLRFRIADITTFPAPSGIADMRARTSAPLVVSGVNDAGTCGLLPAPCAVTVQGTTLEEPPSQPNGGAFNSSMSAGTVTLATPLAPGASINVRFLLGLQQTGSFKFTINFELLP